MNLPYSGLAARLYKQPCVALLALLAGVVLLLSASTSLAFVANLSGSPNPNSGDYTVSWDNPGSLTYYLEENPGGMSGWRTITSSNGTSHAITGKTPDDYLHRLKYRKRICTGWPEPSCYFTTRYSETATVTVEAPPSGGGGEDPFPQPAPFTPPGSADFPDATIVNPYVPGGDVGLNSVGALHGQGAVTGGQASYSIPIVVPPGRKGMQPSVSLNYSSSSGNGVVGVGWSLSANSSISRCAATAAQDGYSASVQFNASRDRLCLDGQRLMVVTGSYGASGATYRTELDIFARIRQYHGINSASSYFTVEYKDGTTSRFGYNSNSRLTPAGRTEPLTWLISDSQDRSGNTITYGYIDHGNGERNLDAIHYTGFNGASGDRHVRFVYAGRPDTRTYFMAGGKTRSTRRLAKIRTEYRSTPVREYTLDYGSTQSLSSNRSLLRSVEECAYRAGVRHCFPATSFEWLERAPQYGIAGAAPERLKYFNGSSWQVIHADKRWLHDVVPNGDVNGDGVRDWPGVTVNAEGQQTARHDPTILANCFTPLGSAYLKCLQVDFNNDGLTDSFRKNNGKLEVRATVQSGSSSWINTGVNWATTGSGHDDHPLGFADFNGDGWMDLAFVQSTQLWVYFHTKNTSAPYSNSNRQLVYTYSLAGGLSRTTEVQIFGDMDGNGTPDFVVSRILTGNETPGLPQPTSILLATSGAGGTLSLTTRAITNHHESQFVNSHFFHDVNGDGLMDLLAVAHGPSDLLYRLNTGSDFALPWKSLGVALPKRNGRWYHSGNREWSPYSMPVMSKVLAVDYDGDGRDELLVARDVVASGCAYVLSAGTSGSWHCDDDLYGEFQANVSSHAGSPINGAVADDSIRKFNVIRFSEDAAGNFSATESPTSIEASASQTAVVDATGDGLPDIVTVFGCRGPEPTGCRFNDQASGMGGTVNSAYQTEGAWIYRNTGTATDTPGNSAFEYAPYDLMSATQDAFGNRHEWTYKPLSSGAYNTAGSRFYQATHGYQQGDPDYFHFASSMYVVAEHRASNGIGGLNSTKYRYRGAIYNTRGRGFQGFKSIIVEEDLYPGNHALANTDKISRTDFHQKWPTSGIVEKTCTFLTTDGYADDNPNCTGSVSRVVTDTIHNAATSGGARFVAIRKQTTSDYDLATRGLVTTTITDRTFDTAGNVTYESQYHSDAWTTGFTEKSRTMSLDWSNWWLDKVTSAATTHNPVAARHGSSPYVDAQQDQVKTVTTSYDSYDSAKRLPTRVSVSANDTPLTRVINTSYNSYGLPIHVSTTGTGITAPRSVTTTYTSDGISQAADGYFAYTIANSLGHTAIVNTDPAHGRPTRQWDANGLLSTTAYDAFGRLSETTAPGAPTVYQRYEWCDGAVWCYAGLTFRIEKISAAKPLHYSYFDSFARERRVLTRNFLNSEWHHSLLTDLDARGQVTFEMAPFDPSLGETWGKGTRYQAYDALGRLTLKSVDQANGQTLTTTYAYSGLKTTINAGGINMERTYNGLGQLVETKDGNGGYTRYAYDGAGNPIAMADPKMVSMGNTVSIKTSFDALGHKQWVEDPDWWDDISNAYGSKVFTYNALGEVLNEIDPNGDIIELAYDALGRVTERRVNGELVAKWHFDNPDTYKGLGLLDFEDSQFRPDGSRLQKFYYYSAAATGRKDLLQVTHRFYENNNPNDFTDYPTQYFTDGFYNRPKGLRYPGGSSVAYEYNSAGHLIKEKDPASSVVYRHITARGSRFQVTAASIGNHIGSYQYHMTASFHARTGQVRSMSVTNGSAPLQTLSYTYDNFGNLSTRHTSVGGGTTETFSYDNLQRLTGTQRSYASGSPSTVSYAYDGAGSFTSKSDYASTYTYGSARPHAVTRVNLAAGGSATFAYDQNGNMTQGHGEKITYDAFNKPLTISNAAQTLQTRFTYGADLMRYRQITPQGSRIYYIDKLMEIETVGSTSDYRHFIGDIAILTKTGSLNDSNPGIRYTFRDRLGGISMLGDRSGTVTEYRAYDAFGKPRQSNWTDKSTPKINSGVTDRGFTDHEHLDDWQLIHMNGRGYDYNLGRFLSVDPFIQEPGNSQSINAYSYILNNPLSGTDPSGYFATRPFSRIKLSGKTMAVASNGMALAATSNGKVSGQSYESEGLASPLELAKLSEHVYSGHGKLPRNWSSVDPDEVGRSDADFRDDWSGFKAGLYRNSKSGTYVLAFAGTDTGTFEELAADMATNLQQAGGLETSQYQSAIGLTGHIAQKIGSENLELTGHSMGGGLASAAAIVNRVHATTFNAAGLHPDTVGRFSMNLRTAQSYVDAYSVEGEALSLTQDKMVMPVISPNMNFEGWSGQSPLQIKRIPLLPTTAGKRIKLPAANGQNKFQRHRIASVIQSLDGN